NNMHDQQQNRIEAVRKCSNTKTAAALEKLDQLLQQIDAETEPDRHRLSVAVQHAMQRLQDMAVTAANRKLKAEMEADAAANQREWNRLQIAIQGLGELEKSLLETLTITGIQVITGRLQVGE